MDILIVEDEDPKRRHITEFLMTVVPIAQIRVARSVTSALDQIDNAYPDLLLLDMSLPTFDVSEGEPGGRPQGFGGLEIARNMAMANTLFPTAIVTGYEAFPTDTGEQVQLRVLAEELETILGKKYFGVLHFSSALDDWKAGLVQVLNSVEDLKN